MLDLPRVLLAFFFAQRAGLSVLHSFPTRRSSDLSITRAVIAWQDADRSPASCLTAMRTPLSWRWRRSEEHTSELQSPCNLVCRPLLEKKKEGRVRDVPHRSSDGPVVTAGSPSARR